MPLPLQRGFYDDVRAFMRRDVKVQTEGHAPTPGEQVRGQLLWGGLLFLFLLGTLGARLHFAREELHERTRATSAWDGVAVQHPQR
jgi:hypothetical protein